MDERQHETHMIKVRTIIAALVVAVPIVLVLASEWGQDSKFVETYIEKPKLNTLGDFLAGIFAPLAFIGIAGAFYLQHLQLRLALRENAASEVRQLRQIALSENEARLNLASVQANYQLQLYEKRIKAYRKVREAAIEYGKDNGRENGTLSALNDAVEEAEFVFEDDLRDWLREIRELAANVRHLSARIEHSQRIQSSGQPLSDEQMRQFDQVYDAWDKKAGQLFNLFFKPNFRDRFEPYLRVPARIEAPELKKVDRGE